jgi:uncharacterized membrane protein YadS
LHVRCLQSNHAVPARFTADSASGSVRLATVGFVGVAIVNSIWGIPSSLQKVFTTLSAGFLASAMAALGLDTDLVKVTHFC